MSDTATTPVTPADEPAIEENPEATPAATADTGFGTFDDEGNYTPREITSDDLGMSFADAIDGTMVEIKDGMMDPEGESLTKAGMICGMICCIISAVIIGLIILFMILGGGLAALNS